MQDISALIAKLKKERPELENEPLLDDIESAASGEEEETPDEMESPEEDMGENPADEWMPPSDDEEEPAAKPGKKIPKFPF